MALISTHFLDEEATAWPQRSKVTSIIKRILEKHAFKSRKITSFSKPVIKKPTSAMIKQLSGTHSLRV
jgi:hypothetical protein